MQPERVNVADRLTAAAAAAPSRAAVIARSRRGEQAITFGQLDQDAAALARGLVDLGVRPGARLALLVPPSPEFVALVFALLRSGATTVLIDSGMGRRHLVDCLAAAAPEGFVAVSRAQAVRTVLRRRFPRARVNVTLGRRWFWGGPTYRRLLRQGGASGAALPATGPDDLAAIIFTSGSTGPPKGVYYTHRMFETQAAEIQRAYGLQPGGVDLACFALFGLFNAAMGVTTVFPRMDFSRPAAADPLELLAAANAHRVTQAFASPAIWDKLSRHCRETGAGIPSLRKIFSCGAPVRADVIDRTLQHVAASGAEMHTPYGATEALPVSTVEAREVLGETAAKTAAGAGVCVGRKFESIEWRVIRVSDEPIASIEDAEELPQGEIGELIVRGPQVSAAYLPVDSPGAGGLSGGDGGANVLAKIPDQTPPSRASRLAPRASPWHRMGDVGYLDAQGCFWYCGRKSHRVETAAGLLYSECVEAVFNEVAGVGRCALVGVGPTRAATPAIVFELTPERTRDSLRPDERFAHSMIAIDAEMKQIAPAASNPPIEHFLLHGALPVDVRHNAKINREALAEWAARQLAGTRVGDDPAR